MYAGSTGSELAYMFCINLGNLGFHALGGPLSGCYVSSSNNSLDKVGPFSNLQPGPYSSGSEYAPNSSGAWIFGMVNGNQSAYDKIFDGYAWAVSPGDVGAVPEAQTYALMLAGLGLVGWRARRRG